MQWWRAIKQIKTPWFACIEEIQALASTVWPQFMHMYICWYSASTEFHAHSCALCQICWVWDSVNHVSSASWLPGTLCRLRDTGGHLKGRRRKKGPSSFLRLVSFRDNPAVIVFYTSSSWFLFVVPATFLELVGLCSLRPTSTRQRAPCLGQSQLQLRSPQLLYCNNSNLYPLLFTPYGWQLLSTAALSMIF